MKAEIISVGDELTSGQRLTPIASLSAGDLEILELASDTTPP